MPSEAVFYDNLRVKEVIEFSAKLYKKDCRREAALLCDRFMLDTEKKIRELSLGNRKKVGIVCAFQHRPPLYILDEPTSGLDPLMQKEFFALAEERNKEGATVFLSSHVLSEIQRHCHSAAIIRAVSYTHLHPAEQRHRPVCRRHNIYPPKWVQRSWRFG